jgi:hypothetical protein
MMGNNHNGQASPTMRPRMSGFFYSHLSDDRTLPVDSFRGSAGNPVMIAVCQVLEEHPLLLVAAGRYRLFPLINNIPPCHGSPILASAPSSAKCLASAAIDGSTR